MPTLQRKPAKKTGNNQALIDAAKMLIKRLRFGDLRQHFPVFADCLPMEIGIRHKFFERLREKGIDEKRAVVRLALKMHTRSPRYLANMSADGAKRYGLDLQIRGDVLPEHKQLAKKGLDKFTERKQKKRRIP